MITIKKLSYFFILMIFAITGFGGNRKSLDSLLKVVASSVNDTNKIHSLQKICIKYRNMGELDSSILFAERAIVLSDSLLFDVGYMNANQAMGNTLLAQGNLNGALRYFLKTLDRAESTNNIKAKSSACLNIGNVYYYLLQFEKALEYFKLSLKYKIELKQTKGLAFVYNNIGETYRLLNKKEDALEYLNKALVLWKESNDLQGQAQSLNNLGIIYMTDKDYDRAEKNFLEAFNNYKALDLSEGMCSSTYQLGELYFLMGQYKKAEGFFIRSLATANDKGFLEHISSNNNRLSDICKLTGREGKALEYFKDFIKARDSIRNSEITKKAAMQEMEFKFNQHQAVLKLEQDKKDAIVESEFKYQKKQRNYLIVGFALVILLAFLILWGYIQKRRSNVVLEEKNGTIEKQKVILEEKQKEIIDSINYAKRIQYTLLAHDQFLRKNLVDHFTFFHPKDIVSGDFYWATKQGSKFYLAVCDSTGHGVPGAFMSLLNIGFLSEAINEKGIENPNEVFDFARKKLLDTISQEGQKDGFDGILMCMDTEKGTINYSAANNIPILISNGEISVLPCDRMPVGYGERKDNFSLFSIETKKGDMLYLYTDGFADQFGGPKGKKFKYKQLNELLVQVNTKPLNNQHEELKKTFEAWKGDLEQVDDVCVIGIRL